MTREDAAAKHIKDFNIYKTGIAIGASCILAFGIAYQNGWLGDGLNSNPRPFDCDEPEITVPLPAGSTLSEEIAKHTQFHGDNEWDGSTTDLSPESFLVNGESMDSLDSNLSAGAILQLPTDCYSQ
jgi:hypothetical protein